MHKEKKFVSDNPVLMREWNWDKNITFSPYKITVGSHKIVWWKCEKGHEWENSVKNRSDGNNCPYCGNKRVLAGYNDLATMNPDLVKEWNYEKNGDLKPNEVLPGSEKKVWWKCKEGHVWEAIIYNRNKGVGCPYCNNRKILIGYNDLASTNPGLAKEWNHEKNGELTPKMVTYGSHKKVWWKCKNGHEWEAEVKVRSSGENCPFCSNKKVLAGYNDLATLNPELVKEWNYERNGNLKPSEVLPGSQRKVWWKCKDGHEWEATIDSRNRGRKCPYCSNNVVLAGYNDLLFTNPEIAKEWDYNRNREKPNEVFAGSNNKKYWFICPKGHSYSTTLLNRKKGTACPICAMERHTSFPEKAIFYYIKKCFNSAKENYHSPQIGTMELDVFLPTIKVGIEYDGVAWHKNYKRDLKKDKKCSENGIHLIRIREVGCHEYSSDSIKKYIAPYDMQELGKAIDFIFDYVNSQFGLTISADVDVDRDRVAILEQMNLSEKENSIAAYRPEIKDFWDTEKNGKITPEQISHGSFKRIYLKCRRGHEWETTASVFEKRPYCPYCSGRKVWTGYNDLFTTNPELKNYWSPKNTLNPEKIGKGCNSKVIWLCPTCGGEYEMTVCNRIRNDGCPYCSGHRVLKGYNDLESSFPEIAKEWNYEKNDPLKPDEVTKKSNKKVWWKCCVCGHEWQAVIHSRQRSGCPKCAKINFKNPNAKEVLQISLDGQLVAEYPSASEAERKTGIKHISSVCRNERETSGGYKWKYKNTSP